MRNSYVSREAKTGRVLFIRLQPGTDLLTGILEACADNSIRYAVVSTVIGSLTRARFVYAVPDKEGKLGIRYSQPVEVEGPLEFIGGQGVIGISDR
ncbi:MAG: DNA-binding protein, partial [Bacillota bacterium]|nr:DNA-binding protein [Bacillota bacterium]